MPRGKKEGLELTQVRLEDGFKWDERVSLGVEHGLCLGRMSI